MKRPLRVLIVEDSAFDAHMMVNILRQGGYEPEFDRVETAGQMKAALASKPWQVILADYNLPEFNALAALKITQDSGLDLPFIIVSGGIGEDVAVEAMKAGAHDYLMKGNLNRLVPAVERELREASIRASQRDAKKALRESEQRYRLLWETCPDAVILMNPEGRILFVNPAVRDVFGYAPEELIGSDLTMLQPERLRGSHRTGITRYLQTGIKRMNWRATETVGLRKDGAQIPIEVSYSDMILDGERRFVGFVRDITERKRAERELRDHQEQFRVAREIQQHLFPKSAPALKGFDISGTSYPTEATGGDYFDYLPMLRGRLGIVVGDVTGHGVGPAMLMAETRAYLRLVSKRRDDPGEILSVANAVLAEDVGRERYITLFWAALDPKNRTLIYASAGHPPAHLIGSDGHVKHRLAPSGMPLGLHPDTTYRSSPELPLKPGDILLLSTDGIEESVNARDELFGTERMLDLVRAKRHEPAQTLVKLLYQAVREFAGDCPQEDDLTAVFVKVLNEKG
ncbi:MAG: SpoIIE family protein phosphatase [Verrucomicrobia bacterium]|nr:SpoIIE family protein phosphatase [Verrucomicrobiota bacterium]